MKKITELFEPVVRPVRVVQFGEGNFLRAFVDYFINRANEAGIYDGNVAIVKPISFGSLDRFDAQKNLYTVSLRGKQNGATYVENRVIRSVSQTVDCYNNFEAFLALARLETVETIVSNTTEAGIVYDPTDRFDAVPPATYPGKLTRFLYERFTTFSGDPARGLLILPCELIEDNGGKLRECVLKLAADWSLGDAFLNWVKESCIFCATLVDRIVTGFPKEGPDALWEEFGYEDQLADTAEPFGLWVIEGPKAAAERFPLDKAGLPIIFTDCQKPYRERKVRILNGAHTSTVLAGYLAGKDTVGECMADPLIRSFMETAVKEEIVPQVPLTREESLDFAASVFERFENPFVRHALLSISLNSVSKWKARVLPTVRDQFKADGTIPALLTFSFAALLAFYTGKPVSESTLLGTRGDETYEIHDDAAVLAFFADVCQLPIAEYVHAAASNTAFWGEDLCNYPGFEAAVCHALELFRTVGAEAALRDVLA